MAAEKGRNWEPESHPCIQSPAPSRSAVSDEAQLPGRAELRVQTEVVGEGFPDPWKAPEGWQLSLPRETCRLSLLGVRHPSLLPPFSCDNGGRCRLQMSPFIMSIRASLVASGKESACQCRRCGFSPWVGKMPWRRKWQPTPVLVPGEPHGQRSLVGYSPRGHESDTTERLANSDESSQPSAVRPLWVLCTV